MTALGAPLRPRLLQSGAQLSRHQACAAPGGLRGLAAAALLHWEAGVHQLLAWWMTWPLFSGGSCGQTAIGGVRFWRDANARR
jgi:hypothetical protein